MRTLTPNDANHIYTSRKNGAEQASRIGEFSRAKPPSLHMPPVPPVTGGRPKAVTGPPGRPLVSGHARSQNPHHARSAPAQMSPRSVDVQMDRYALTAGAVDRSAGIPRTV
jgi:hypothetical protein